MSLKVVKFDTKMYLDFSHFQGQTSTGGGGGQALVQKWGQVSDGGIDNIFAGWGTPIPPGKTPAELTSFQMSATWPLLCEHLNNRSISKT